MHNPRILFAAGGTGGHVYPAIAIADAVKSINNEAEILFAGTKSKMEWTAVPKAGYAIAGIWISGFHRKFDLRNLLFPIKLMVSLIQSYMLLKKFKPMVVVACGGYVAGPIGWVASKLKITVVLQEQNSFPGVTNRMLAKYAATIFTAFDEAEKYFGNEKVVNAGNPTRNTLANIDKASGLKAFDFEPTKPVILIIGGSLGAASINEAVKANLHGLAGLQILWQCGPRYYDKLSTEIDLNTQVNVRLVPYLDNMPEAYAAADLVISRAGASSCSELMLIGKPSILIPSPNVAGDHQTKNALSMAKVGASLLLEDSTAYSGLPSAIHSIIHNEKLLDAMSQVALSLAKPQAAYQIADKILEFAQYQRN